jgi:hypothetical protein
MRTPYLIQRMIRRKDPIKNPWLNNLYRMDYMGSSEFEWGALPKSLKRFTKNFDNLVIHKVDVKNFKDEPLFLIDLSEMVEQYPIQDLIDGKFNLHERLNFDYAWKGEGGYGNHKKPFDPIRHPSAWWDIDNDVMFTFKKLHINKLLAAIGEVLKKKKLEGEKEWY